MPRTMRVLDLGLMPYSEAWQVQLDCLDVVRESADDVLIFVEHPPVLTLGAGFHAENLLFTKEQYAAKGIDVVTTDRGGDVTYHGPGQLVIYPIFDLTRHGKDLHKWMRELEEAIIVAMREFGLEGSRFPPHTGVWVGDEKLAAIGVKVKKWISIHGIALNCANSLDPFGLIIPCGIPDYGVTSLSQLRGYDVQPDDVKDAVIKGFETVFDLGRNA